MIGKSLFLLLFECGDICRICYR